MIYYIIGYMGSGKTTLARMASQSLGFMLGDTDAEVEQHVGQPIAHYVRQHGEQPFREAENAVLLRLTESIKPQADAIVATGGGLPCREENMEYMNSHGTTVYLQWSAENLVERIRLSGIAHRPMLDNVPPAELLPFVSRHLMQREVFYKQAHHIICCDGIDDYQIFEQFRKLV